MSFEELNGRAEAAIRNSDRIALSRAISDGERLAPELQGAERELLFASLHHWNGFEYYLTAHYSDAMRLFEEALAGYQALDNQTRMARVLSNIGACHQFMGEHAAASVFMTRSLAIYTQLGDRLSVADITGNIGTLKHFAGAYDEALACYLEALAVHHELDDRRGIARTNGNIGNVYKETGQFATAVKYYDEALEIYQEIGDPAGIARITGNIGGAYNAMGDYPNALEAFHQSLSRLEELGDRLRIARMKANIASVYSNIGDLDTSRALMFESLAVHEEIADKGGIAHLTGNIGQTYLNEDRYDDALAWLRRGVTLAREVGNRREEAHYINDLCEVLLKLGRVDESRELLHASLHLSADLPVVQVGFLQRQADLAAIDGDVSTALALNEQALAIADDHSLRSLQMEVHKSIRDLHRASGPLETYIAHDDAYELLVEELRGKMQQRRLAVSIVERRLSEEHRSAERQRALLHNALPSHIADRLLKEERVVADLHENVGILFLDIVSFTSIASGMAPHDLVDLLNRIFTICDETSQRWGLTKIKTIGDSYLAVSGLVGGNTAHVHDIASAAVDLQHALKQQRFTIRMGLHCGPVVAGVIGKERLQYDIWGDAVNVAARMEQTCEPGRIHVSEAFAMALQRPVAAADHATPQARWAIASRGPIEIKGKGVMQTYWLDDAAADASH